MNALVDAWGSELGATGIQFPPVVNRATFEETNYVQSFPDLMGAVHVFTGGNKEHAELLPAIGIRQGLVRPARDGRRVPGVCGVPPRLSAVHGDSSRRRADTSTSRATAFGTSRAMILHACNRSRCTRSCSSESPSAAQEHRDAGLEVGINILRRLGLEMSVVPANDPFFGRLGTAMATNQMDEVLKLEGTTPIGRRSPGSHHFWAIVTATISVARSPSDWPTARLRTARVSRSASTESPWRCSGATDSPSKTGLRR